MATHAHACAQLFTPVLTARHTLMLAQTTHAKMEDHVLSQELVTRIPVLAQLVTLDLTVRSITHAMRIHV